MKFFNITQNKNIFLNALILLIVSIFSIKIYLKQSSLLTNLNDSKSLETNINKVLKSIIKLDETVVLLTKFVNRKDLASVLNTLTTIAKVSEVKILSIKPIEIMDYPLYVVYPYYIVVKTDNFENIGKFLSKLESHKDVYIVTGANINTDSVAGTETTEASEFLVLELTVNTIYFKTQK